MDRYSAKPPRRPALESVSEFIAPVGRLLKLPSNLTYLDVAYGLKESCFHGVQKLRELGRCWVPRVASLSMLGGGGRICRSERQASMHSSEAAVQRTRNRSKRAARKHSESLP